MQKHRQVFARPKTYSDSIWAVPKNESVQSLLVWPLTSANSRFLFNEMRYINLLFTYFLPREATRSAVLPWQVVRPSVRPSVCPSVTLRYRDHIGWNSAKIISRLISLTISLSADPNMTDLLQREHPQILAGIWVGYGKFSIFDI